MAGWVIVVRELYERGPLCLGQFRPQYSKGPVREISPDLARAVQLGLITAPGRHGSSAPRPYVLTEKGRAFAEGRLTAVYPGYQSRGRRAGVPKGHCVTLRPTWLAALPAANEIRLCENAKSSGTSCAA